MKGNLDSLIAARAMGLSISDAAAVAGMSSRTAQRRLANPEAATLVQERRAKQAEEDSERLMRWSWRALEKVAELMESDSENTAYKACMAILRLKREAVDLNEVRAQFDEMSGQLLLMMAERREREDDE